MGAASKYISIYHHRKCWTVFGRKRVTWPTAETHIPLSLFPGNSNSKHRWYWSDRLAVTHSLVCLDHAAKRKPECLIHVINETCSISFVFKSVRRRVYVFNKFIMFTSLFMSYVICDFVYRHQTSMSQIYGLLILCRTQVIIFFHLSAFFLYFRRTIFSLELAKPELRLWSPIILENSSTETHQRTVCDLP